MADKRRNNPARLHSSSAAPSSAALLALLAMALVLTSCQDKPAAPEPPTPVVTNAPATSTTARPEFQKLVGRWLRPDGGYILEIKSIDASGAMQADYFNPNPIHVSKAEVKDSAGAIRVFVELRDTGYPGCTYKLVLDPATDSMVGTYFQAALQQEFSVGFSREK